MLFNGHCLNTKFLFQCREMVRGAHLKAVNRALTSNKNPRPRIWNNISSRNQEGSLAGETFCNCPISVSSQHHFPTSSSQFLCLWRRSEQEARLSLLFKLGPAGLGHLFRIDIPAELLGEIFQTLLFFDAEDVPVVVALLEALTEIKRFSLGLQFLNSEERATCKQLIRKLRDSLVLREQDLAELGVTEWSLQQLAEKYQIRLLPE